MGDLCVVTVSEGNAPRVCAALEGLLDHAGWVDLEAVVVDDGDGSVAEHVEHRLPGVRTVRCASADVGSACNRTVQEADARYVLFLDPNLTVCEGSLASLVSLLDRRPDVAVVGTRQIGENGELVPSIGRFPAARHTLAEALGIDRLPAVRRLLGERQLDRRRYERESDCEWTSGCLLARRTALASVGWLDEGLPGFARDADLCARLGAQGWRVIHSPAVTALWRRPSGAESERLEAQAAQARLRFAEKHLPRAAGRYRRALALGYLLRVGVYAFSGSYDRRRRAARAALTATVRARTGRERPSTLRHLS
jgi:GT2 family glycosyltransferase